MREKTQRPYASTLDPSYLLDPIEGWLCCVMGCDGCGAVAEAERGCKRQLS